MEKNLSANAGDIRDMSFNPGSGRSPGGEYGSPLEYSCVCPYLSWLLAVTLKQTAIGKAGIV